MTTKQVQGKLMTLSCSELAKETNIDKGCWSRYLNGKFAPSITNLRKISKTYHITIEEVLEQIEARIPKNS
jgi:transcriptional regulator with XRE-family HTH domain